MKNKLLNEINAIITLALRDISLFMKSPGKLIPGLIMPVIFLAMFGGQLSQNMGMHMGFDFNTYMLVGMLVQGLFMIMGYGIVSLVEDRENDFTQEILVSPVSRYSIILGKIIGSSFACYIVFFFTLFIGYCMGVRLSTVQFITLLSFSPLVCLASGSFGVLCIGFIHKSSTAGFVIMMLAMTQTLLSGALIPVNQSTGVMAVLSRALPMTYCIDFMRGIFYQTMTEGIAPTLYSPFINLVIIIAFTAVFFTAGTAGFIRAEKNR